MPMLRPLAAALLLIVLVAAPARAQQPTADALRLPWPVEGTVSEGFGRVMNARLGVAAISPGVVIRTAPAENVRAVAAGTVVRLGLIPEYGTFVIVRHGETMTCYGNLSVVDVKEGDAVRLGQSVGRAGTAAQPKGAALFFAVFHGGTPVDPLVWLRAN